MSHIPRYLVGFSLATAGQDKDNLGSDETETIAVSWAVIDALEPKLVAIHSSWVQPADLSKVNWDLVKEKGAVESDLQKAPRLADVLGQFDVYVEQSLCDADGRPAFVLCCDGQLPIRQVLYPEAMRKEMRLSATFTHFFDIRKEIRNQRNNNEDVGVSVALGEVLDLANCLTDGLAYSTEEPRPHIDCKDLGAAIMKLLMDARQKGLEDGCFREPDRVKLMLEHGICSKEDSIDSNLVVRARGLPWQSSDQDVAKFFVGLNIAKAGVALCLSREGRRNGEALVRFELREHRDMALRRHRQHMGQRYIEIYRATGEDFVQIASGNNSEAQEFLTRGADVIVRMRGLPYDCTAQQILDFFGTGENGIQVMEGEHGILFVNKSDGRATGDAFVLFKSEADATKALTKHKEVIGTRYIELFRSTTAEVQVINKSMEPQRNEALSLASAGLVGAVPGGGMGLAGTLPSLLPQQVVISGCRKDCIRLRGLPYEAQVQHILEFLGDYAKHIVFQGVHMVYNAQGHPSGEAFIQMDSEHAAASASADRHNKYMQIAKKQRYIEVFQCSADDMNLVLTGPTTGPVLPGAQSRLPLSPGNGMLPGGHHPGLTSPPFSQGNLMQMQMLQQIALQNQLAAGARPALFGALNGGLIPVVSTNQGPIVYWPYPSPPVSPSAQFSQYYAAQAAAAAALATQQIAPDRGPAIVLMRGLPFNASTTDVLNFFQGFPEIAAECVQIQRAANGSPTGDCIVTFGSRMDAERAILEKNLKPLGPRPVELFLYSI